MEKIEFDTGVREFAVGGGVLRFDPEDLNLFARLQEAPEKLAEIEKELQAEAEGLAPEDSAAVLRLLQDADSRVKALLGWAFGPGNDFEKIFGGGSCLSMRNGKRAVERFLEAVLPVVTAGAEACAKRLTAEAVDKAKVRRAKK